MQPPVALHAQDWSVTAHVYVQALLAQGNIAKSPPPHRKDLYELMDVFNRAHPYGCVLAYALLMHVTGQTADVLDVRHWLSTDYILCTEDEDFYAQMREVVSVVLRRYARKRYRA